MTKRTKKIRNVIIVIAVLVVIYHGRTIKAQRVKAARLIMNYEEEKISKEEYERLNKQNTYLRIFLNPKEVLRVD